MTKPAALTSVAEIGGKKTLSVISNVNGLIKWQQNNYF